MPSRTSQQAPHPQYRKCLYHKRSIRSTLQLFPLHPRPLATLQIHPLQHQSLATLQILPLQPRPLATLRFHPLQHHPLLTLRFPSIHQNLIRTLIRRVQHHGHRNQDYPRTHCQSPKEMLRNFEVSGIASKAQCTRISTSRKSTSSIIWYPC